MESSVTNTKNGGESQNPEPKTSQKKDNRLYGGSLFLKSIGATASFVCFGIFFNKAYQGIMPLRYGGLSIVAVVFCIIFIVLIYKTTTQKSVLQKETEINEDIKKCL